MNFPNRPCLMTIGLPQLGHSSSVGSSSGRSPPFRLRLYLHFGYAEHVMNSPKRPRRFSRGSPPPRPSPPVPADLDAGLVAPHLLPRPLEIALERGVEFLDDVRPLPVPFLDLVEAVLHLRPELDVQAVGDVRRELVR